MDRHVHWLVFGLVVALVVAIGSIGLALVLPGATADGGIGPMEGDRAGGSFAWYSDRGIDLQGVLAPLWLLLLVGVPLSLLGLVVTGLVWASRPGRSAIPGPPASCRGCGQGMESGWRFCPHCGEQGDNSDDQ